MIKIIATDDVLVSFAEPILSERGFVADCPTKSIVLRYWSGLAEP